MDVSALLDAYIDACQVEQAEYAFELQQQQLQQQGVCHVCCTPLDLLLGSDSLLQLRLPVRLGVRVFVRNFAVCARGNARLAQEARHPERALQAYQSLARLASAVTASSNEAALPDLGAAGESSTPACVGAGSSGSTGEVSGVGQWAAREGGGGDLGKEVTWRTGSRVQLGASTYLKLLHCQAKSAVAEGGRVVRGRRVEAKSKQGT